MQVCCSHLNPVKQVLNFHATTQMLGSDVIDTLTKEIEAEKEAEAERKKAEKRAGGVDSISASS